MYPTIRATAVLTHPYTKTAFVHKSSDALPERGEGDLELQREMELVGDRKLTARGLLRSPLSVK